MRCYGLVLLPVERQKSLKINFEVAYNLMERLETKLIFFAFIFDDTFKELGICGALIHL